MAVAYTVALVGFAQNESATFESFFQLAARRPPAYTVQDEVMDAQILIVNADNTQALHLVCDAELPGKVLLVGHNDGDTGWPLQRKPVRLVSVLAAMDELVGQRRPAAARANATTPVSPRQGADRGFAATEPADSRKVPLVPAARLRPPSFETEFPATQRMERSRAAPFPQTPTSATPARPAIEARPSRMPRPGVMGLTDFGGLDVLPTPAAGARSTSSRSTRAAAEHTRSPVPEIRRGDVLLVAESLVEGRILHKRFKRYNLAIDWSREAAQSLAMLKAHPYRLVVIDRLNGEPDAYQICRSAKQRRLPNGQSPVVVMFAPSAGTMDRLKAGLAGSDAYLSRSVGEGELYKVLAQHRLVNLDGFEQTNISC